MQRKMAKSRRKRKSRRQKGGIAPFMAPFIPLAIAAGKMALAASGTAAGTTLMQHMLTKKRSKRGGRRKRGKRKK